MDHACHGETTTTYTECCIRVFVENAGYTTRPWALQDRALLLVERRPVGPSETDSQWLLAYPPSAAATGLTKSAKMTCLEIDWLDAMDKIHI